MKPKPKSLGEVAMKAWLNGPGGLYDPTDWSRSARAVIREYERRQWRPIDTAPKLVYMTVYTKAGTMWKAYQENGVWYKCAGDALISEPTHWRPLPKGPR
jgi:hypothetical protein